MLNTTLKSIMIGGKIATLAALMGGTAMAQTTETVVVPAPALEADKSVGFVTESDIPMIEQLDNDQMVAETLIAQGFTDIHILREGALMTVTATRAGMPIELVYSVANGRLVSIDGQETRAAAEASGEPEAGVAAPDDTVSVDDDAADDATDDGATDEGATDDADTDDGATDDGMSDDTSADDGMSDDGGSDDGAADGATDSGTEGDAGDAGGDTGGDSGESDGSTNG